MDIKSWIKAARLHAGFTQTQLGEPLGVSKGNVSAWEKGRHEPSFEQLVRIAEVTRYEEPLPGLSSTSTPARAPAPKAEPPWPFPGVPPAVIRSLSDAQIGRLEGAILLALGQMGVSPQETPKPKKPYGGVASLDDVADEFPMGLRQPAPWEGGPTTKQDERELAELTFDQNLVNVVAGSPPAANDKFEKVAELSDVRLAAGHGIENDNELANGFIQFRRSFLRSVGADGGRGRVVYAKGDSMEPVIKDGAALLVVPDEGITLRDLVPGAVYAINYDGKMIVKALAKDRLTGQWVARSFNQKYRDIPLEGDAPVRILGRVVWTGAKL
ncbi:hypothetical protein CAL14_05460 [Bordetella genomosp. 9]|uniref:XRE family transcriptional regulator n=1 Tax=Bordetella genomosp. 9 TaxID=1416803 RepID=UPI000A296C1D|nr:XRE family transcriptional regulator [Bordetella genomosp. 9]ARP89802.1 hypothetical protein CAL14_05460 [Bordetella genomosp. 9]